MNWLFQSIQACPKRQFLGIMGRKYHLSVFVLYHHANIVATFQNHSRNWGGVWGHLPYQHGTQLISFSLTALLPWQPYSYQMLSRNASFLHFLNYLEFFYVLRLKILLKWRQRMYLIQNYYKTMRWHAQSNQNNNAPPVLPVWAKQDQMWGETQPLLYPVPRLLLASRFLGLAWTNWSQAELCENCRCVFPSSRLVFLFSPLSEWVLLDVLTWFLWTGLPDPFRHHGEVCSR